ncbi:hypothetical protein [Paeniglutamicibacter antarcticus]|uniref:Uncharacterized protein n=1 Tax=Paeniglutamicibacter antarcticus TaxID=494023 RepID=A0ABP9TFP1_9MICC
MGNSDTQMTESIIEAWADATAQAYNDSLTGLDLSRVLAAVRAFIELYGQSKTLTFNTEYAPTDHFEEHPAVAIALILDTPEAVEQLGDEEEETLEDILGFVEAWAEFDANQQPSLGVSEADDEEDAAW